MNVSSEIIKILDYLGQKFGIAIDWSSQNVMPYIKTLMEKYLTWEISTSTAWIVIMGIAFIVAIVWMFLDANFDWTDGLSSIIALPLIIVAIVVIITQVFDIIRCVNFPELQLFNFLKSQMQSMSN